MEKGKCVAVVPANGPNFYQKHTPGRKRTQIMAWAIHEDGVGYPLVFDNGKLVPVDQASGTESQ